MEAQTDWVRAPELKAFRGKRPQLFEGEIEPSDLCQGAVGDCWLVAAFACASEFPDAIRRMFVTQEYNPRGLYKVRIFDPIKKKFVIVVVDDRIPCKKGTKKPRFMSPNGNELWAIILEKAYAKFCGSYAALDGGVSILAFYFSSSRTWSILYLTDTKCCLRIVLLAYLSFPHISFCSSSYGAGTPLQEITCSR